MQKASRIYSLIFFVVISGCGHSRKQMAMVQPNTKRALIAATADTGKFSDITSIVHIFSDPVEKDTFKLILIGKLLLKGELSFKIINFKGRLIYSNKFSVIEFLGDMDDSSSTKQQKVDTFKMRFNHFFDEENFSSPALDPNQPLDSDYVAINIQKDIRSDPKAVGFAYAYGYEGSYVIAWSKRNKRVVICSAGD